METHGSTDIPSPRRRLARGFFAGLAATVFSLGTEAEGCEEQWRKLQPARRESAERVIRDKCASCHKGPWLDLRAFPFYSDRTEDQRALVKWFLERMEREDWKRMPPVNAPPLTAEEHQVVREWYEAGLPE